MTSLPPCPPRFSTPRNPDRPTLGPKIARVGAQLGTPFMPWQQQVADVAGEVDPATGLLWYRQLVLTVPRQSGKTTLLLAKGLHRCLAMAPGRVVYTAQSRTDARKKWEDDHLPLLESSPLWRTVSRVRKTNGSEAVLFRNGSQYAVMSVGKKSGHGPTIDEAIVDEAFAQPDARLEQACKPSMITRPQPQMWIVSTAGDETSVWLRELVEAGRAGDGDRNAYFEWSAPDDADPADESVWWACMPALGRTAPIDAMRSEYETWRARGRLAEFRRAYLNQWTDRIADESWSVVSEEQWRDLVADPAAHGRVVLAADVTPQRTAGTIAAAWRRPDGQTDVEVVEHQTGTAWMAGRIVEIVQRHRPLAVVIDPTGPAGSLINELEAAGVEVTKPGTRDVVAACGLFYDKVTDSRSIRHAGNSALTAAMAGATKRNLLEGWAWARRGTSVDISPLMAASFAVWGHDKFARRTYDILRSVS